jgi:hypothetical protein
VDRSPGDPVELLLISGVDDFHQECGFGCTPVDEEVELADVESLVETVEVARREYLSLLKGLSEEQAGFRVNDATWTITEITEHLFHAEFGGINLIWRAANGLARGAPVWSGESLNRGLSIEEVVRRTWREREESPASALPRIGGPLEYWVAALRSCSSLLAELKVALRTVPLDETIYPHAISGPLDAGQRLAFLAFHLYRHREQVAEIMSHSAFPKLEQYSRVVDAECDPGPS